MRELEQFIRLCLAEAVLTPNGRLEVLALVVGELVIGLCQLDQECTRRESDVWRTLRLVRVR